MSSPALEVPVKTQPSVLPRLALVALAVAAALVRLPDSWVERYYARGLYAALQPFVTSVSNQVPFALLDVLIAIALGLVVFLLVRGLFRSVRLRTPRPLARTMLNLAVAASGVYLAFLGLWGLNYQRQPLIERLSFERTAVQPARLTRVGREAVRQLNTLHRLAHDRGFSDWGELPMTLGPAFRATHERLTPGNRPVPGTPKWSLLTHYFERAGVSGMTDPFFLEILVDRGLLPFERPFVVAHEWAHLAGYGDEAEANFAGWLTCIGADAPAAYSGWLYLYTEVMAALPRPERAALAKSLLTGPRADLQAIAERARRIAPRLRQFSWRVYDRYLKANRVDAGVESYNRALVLVLGTRFTEGWKPVLRGN